MDLFGVCGMWGMLFSGNSASWSPCLFWPLSTDAAGLISQGSLPPALQYPGLQLQGGFGFQRNELSSLFNSWRRGQSGTEGLGCVTALVPLTLLHSQMAIICFFKPEYENS